MRTRWFTVSTLLLASTLMLSAAGSDCTFLKNPDHPASSRSVYTQALQILVERFSLFVAEHPVYQHGPPCPQEFNRRRRASVAVA